MTVGETMSIKKKKSKKKGTWANNTFRKSMNFGKSQHKQIPAYKCATSKKST